MVKKTIMQLTTDCFFDTDLLSSFLWVNEESILIRVINKIILIPSDVYKELSKVNILKNKINLLIQNGKVKVITIEVGSKEELLFCEFCYSPKNGKRYIGLGESACISLAIVNHGIVGSNNLRDVKEYCNEYKLTLITTVDILLDAYKSKIITEEKGNFIWNRMLSFKRKLPYSSFSECLRKHK